MFRQQQVILNVYVFFSTSNDAKVSKKKEDFVEVVCNTEHFFCLVLLLCAKPKQPRNSLQIW